MPTPLSVSGYIEFKAYTQCDAQQGINVYTYQVASITGGAMTDAQAAAAMSALLAPEYKAYLPAACSYRGLRAQLLNLTPAPVYQTSTSGAGAGLQASDPLPSITAMLITKYSQFSGSGGRGRTFLPFWPEDSNDANGLPTAAAVALADSLALLCFTPLSLVVGGVTAVLNPVIYHRATNTGTLITSHVTREVWHHQVRRANDNKPDVIGP